MIEPQKCFKLYLSIKHHFCSLKYNAVAMNGRIKASDVRNRKDYGLFNSLARKFETSKEAGNYFIANMIYGNKYPLTDIEAGMKNMTKYNSYRLSRETKFKDELDLLSTKVRSKKELFEGDMPLLFTMFLNGKIQVQTLCYMNSMDNFVDSWSQRQSLSLWKDRFLAIKKAEDFLKPTDKMKADYKEFMESLEEVSV